jgi:uncharacterized protein/archaellum component FlaC
MGMANDMNKLAEEIMASYKIRAEELQQRLKDNDSMVKDVQDMLQGFRNDHQEIVASIKANAETVKENAKKLKIDLAQNEKDRLGSFKEMMDGINGTISRIQDEVVGIKVSTENLMKDFSKAHKDMTAKMQDDFAADKSERAEWNAGRLKSFDDMMNGIHDDMSRIKKEVGGIFDDVAQFLLDTDKMMKGFAKEHGEMSAELRADLQANLEKRRDDTRALLNDFNKRLAEISKENQQMAKTLHAELDKSRKDLAASDVQRLKDFKVTMGAIQGKVNEIQTFVNTFLGELKNERVQASAIWEKLAEVKANLSKAVAEPKPAAPPPAKAEPAPKKAESKPAEKVAEPEEKPAPKAEKPKEPVKEEKELTLEEIVLAHINKNPKGVRVSDMEGPLKETRMRIGFVAKQLLDEGKVLKMENRYYPKPSKK